jgi:hypothetical protein
LGSKSDRADKCVDWEIPFPDLLSSDILIINLETLGANVKENLALKNALFNKVQRDIFDILMTSGKQVIVVMPTIPPDLTWLPIYPDCSPIAPAKTVKTLKDQAINQYLENVQTTGYYFRGIKFAFIKEKKPPSNTMVAQEYYSTKLHNICDILNASNQLVGGAFKIAIEHNLTYLGSPVSKEEFVSNPILFLPPPTKVSINRGVDILIKLLTSENEKLCLLY